MGIISEDNQWMEHALSLAKIAAEKGEVPIGAVLVQDNKIIGEGGNSPISLNDPTAHAEIIALRQAGSALQNYRLVNSTLYVTLEPCLMCVGAIVHARVKRVVFGASDPKKAEVNTIFQRVADGFNHCVQYEGNILGEECSVVLKQFFLDRR